MAEEIWVQENGIKRKLSGSELKNFMSNRKKMQDYEVQLQLELQAKQATLDSAIAKLAKLGLTEDEAKAIIGIQ